MAELRLYRDVNCVTALVNPDHIVCVVFNRTSHSADWQATINLISGDQVVLTHQSLDALMHTIENGDK